MASARAPHRASLWRQSRTVRLDSPYVHRSGIARAKGAPRPHTGGGANSTEANERPQSVAAAAPGNGSRDVRKALPFGQLLRTTSIASEVAAFPRSSTG